MELTSLEKRIINGWQKGFPLVSKPYAQLAKELEVSEGDILLTLDGLKERGILSRIGAVVQPNTVGASSLVAMKIPADCLDDVADKVCQEPLVNHNYERENELNLWFVVTASSVDELDAVLKRIETTTGFLTIKLPLEKAFHIDLGFSI